MPRRVRLVLPNYPHYIIQRGQLTADRMFMQEISQKIGRRLELRSPGRPRKKRK